MQSPSQRPVGQDGNAWPVKIPPGIEDGKKIRLRGQGEPARRGGTPGDILLTVRVQPHPFFHRRGNQLHVRVPVTIGEAAAGAKVDVPTPKRHRSAARSARHVQRHEAARSRGTGWRRSSATPGDLLAEVQIVLPKNSATPTAKPSARSTSTTPKTRGRTCGGKNS